MKRSKRILASLMSVLLVLPSLVLPFGASAEEPMQDLDEPYYVVGRLQEKGEKAEGHSDVTENTAEEGNTPKDTYPNTTTTGNINVTAKEPVSLSGLDVNNLAFILDVTISRQDGKTGAGALSYTGNQVFAVYNGPTMALQLAGQPYLTHFASNYSDAAGQTITYIIPWNYVYNETAIKKADVEQVDTFTWFVYNDSWKIDIDQNGQYDDAFGLDIAIENARIVDTSRRPDGSANPVAAVYNDGKEVVVDYQGKRTWNAEKNEWSNSNTVNQFGYAPASNNTPFPADYMVDLDNLGNLQVEFDVMVENADNEPKFDASKFNGILRIKVGEKQVDYQYGWGNFIKATDEWVHVTVPLADVFKGDKALDEDGLLGIVMLFAYDNHDLRTDPENDTQEANQTRFAHAIVHTKDVCVVDKSLLTDLTELTAKITEAEKIDTEGYTADTVEAFETALAAAKAVTARDMKAVVAAALANLTAAIEGLKEETPEPEVPDNYILIGEGPVTSNEAHDFGAAIEPADAVGLSEYADRDLSITYKIKVDKTEQFPTGIEGNDWLAYITNGSFKVNGENVLSGLSLSKGIYSGVTAENVWVDVTVALPKGITSISKVEARFFNDLHKLTSNDNDQKQGVTISIKDAYVVVGDVSPVARWSGKTGEYANLLDGTRLYTDWGAQVDGGTADLSDGSENNVANPNYALSATIQINLKGDSVQGKTLTDVMDKLEYRLRTDGSGEAQFYTLTSEEMHIEGNVVTILSPLTNVTTGNMKWNDVRGLNMGYYVKEEYQNKNADTGKTETANPWDQVTMTLSEVKIVDMTKLEPEPVDKSELATLLAGQKDEDQLAGYTADSVEAYNALFDAAQKVYDNPDATEQEVAEQVEILKSADNVLVEETTPEPEPGEAIMTWSAHNATLNLQEGGNQFYFDWKDADGCDGENPGVNLSGSGANGANPDYALQMDITYNELKSLPEGMTPADLMSTMPIINMRSVNGAETKETSWVTIPAEYCTAKAEGTGYTVSIPLTAIAPGEGGFSWSNVKGLLVRQEIKEDYKTDGYISMTLANVKVVEIEAEPEPPVDKEALTALIETAKAEAAKAGTYTSGSIAALNTAITNAQGVVDNDEADQNAVNEQVTTLQAAIDALVDISGLKTLLDGKKNEDQLAGYTADSVAAYNKLFTDAQAVYENPNATAQQVAEQVEILEGADSVLKEETLEPGPDENIVALPGGEAEQVSAEGHMLQVAVTYAEPVDLSDYANREVSLQFQIKLDKTENFAETLEEFVDGENWLSYIRNGRVKVNGSEIGELKATVGLLNGMKEGEYLTVTVQIPQTIAEQGSLSSLDIYMYNDLHRFGEDMDPEAETDDGTYTEANEGSKGVTMAVKDVKLVIGDELPAKDPNAKMVWSTIVGDYNTLQGGTQVYIDWKSADGYPLDTEEGPGADLSGTAANGANKNYNLQIKFTFKDVDLPQDVTIDQMIKMIFVRLRSSRIDDAEKAAKGLEFTLKAEGDGERLVLEPDEDGVYFINVPLSMIVTENIDWTDVKQMIIRMEIADEYTGTANMTNPYFTLSVQEAKIVDTDPENPDVPVEPTVDKTKLEALIETAQAEAAKTDTYTEDSLAALEDAIDAAQAVVDDAEATQEDVDAQLTALQAAIDELDEIPVTPEPELGDVNGDGKITAMDALMALQAATGKIDLTDEQKVAANVNGDEEVTAEDALVLLQYATQKIDELPHVEPVEEPAE